MMRCRRSAVIVVHHEEFNRNLIQHQSPVTSSSRWPSDKQSSSLICQQSTRVLLLEHNPAPPPPKKNKRKKKSIRCITSTGLCCRCDVIASENESPAPGNFHCVASAAKRMKRKSLHHFIPYRLICDKTSSSPSHSWMAGEGNHSDTHIRFERVEIFIYFKNWKNKNEPINIVLVYRTKTFSDVAMWVFVSLWLQCVWQVEGWLSW